MTSSVRSDLDRLAASWQEIVENDAEPHPDRPVSPADAFFLYRLLLGRNPDRRQELPAICSSGQSYSDFLESVLRSPEFKQARQLLPANQLLMAELADFRFWFNTSDREMGVAMAFGLYEPATVQLVKDLLRPGFNCLDIGAQTGFFTCLMAAGVGARGRVHSFEPMPASFDLLRRNVRENRFEARVQCHQVAASDRATTLHGVKVSNMYVIGDVHDGQPVAIRAVPIGDIVDDPIDLIKLDVEGHEPAVLRGLTRLLEMRRPVIVTEANEYWLRTGSGSSTIDYIAWLGSLGYRVYDIERRRTALNGSRLDVDDLSVLNLVAFPSE